MKKSFFAASVLTGLLAFAGLVSAHAVVKPNQAGIGAFQVFTLGVPSEKSVATNGVRIVLPEGLNYVTPNVKPGWTVEIKKGSEGVATEIDWTGGNIPAGQRDEFSFQVQVPSSEAMLAWKVYQTYVDGSVLSWDQDPSAAQPKDNSGKNDFSKVGPYSTTKIVNDLTPAVSATATTLAVKQNQDARIALVLSVVALVLAVWSLMKKKHIS